MFMKRSVRMRPICAFEEGARRVESWGRAVDFRER
jgi:hypothetical protein